MTDIINGTCSLGNLKSDNNEKYICNICADDIDCNSELIQLKCNPNHYFCYKCIYDWYLKCDKYTGYGNQYPERTCPICKKNGGYLPLNSNYETIDTIHDVPKCCFYSHIKCPYVVKENNLCLKHLKYTNNKCSIHECEKPLYSIYDNNTLKNKTYYCDEHYLLITNKCNEAFEIEIAPNKKIINYCTGRKFKKFGNKCLSHSTIPIVNDSPKDKKEPATACGAPLKSKKGNCSKMGNVKYGGKCHLHQVTI
jgi:hypothetical protein